MNFTRRQMLLAGLGMLVAGCAETTTRYSRRPGTPWPSEISQPSRFGAAATAVPMPRPIPAVAVTASLPGVIPRAWWTRSGPIRSKVNPMNGISRITVHHEGNKLIWFTDERSTREHMEQVRTVHVRDRKWGDIGYHYVIDRAGRVIEGRPIAYQGAHVSNQNEHNVGVMLLGNFEQQSPAPAQLGSLQATLRHLMALYHVPVNRVYTPPRTGARPSARAETSSPASPASAPAARWRDPVFIRRLPGPWRTMRL